MNKELKIKKNLRLSLALSGVIITTAILTLLVLIIFNRSVVLVLSAVLFLVLGLILLLFCLYKMDKTDAMLDKLLVVWHYQPRRVYKYLKYVSSKKRPISSLRLLGACVAFGVAAIVFVLLGSELVPILLLLAAAGLCLILSLLVHPYIKYLLLKLRGMITGEFEEIILSKRGICAYGKLYRFGACSQMFYGATRKEIGSFDSLVFSYSRKRGYQSVPYEIAVPIPPDASDAEINELLEIFNSSKLLYY